MSSIDECLPNLEKERQEREEAERVAAEGTCYYFRIMFYSTDSVYF